MSTAAEAGKEKAAEPQVLRVAGWEKFPWLRAAFSLRAGGVSTVYGDREQNLGWTKDDDPAHVAQNRARFAQAVAAGAPMRLVTVGQMHGAVVRDMDREAEPLMTPEGKAMLAGDGLTTAEPGKLLAVLTADCVPVLLADTRTRAVGAFHAGWRGTLGRIMEVGTAAMRERYGSKPENLVAAIGPCIGACCFEVGDEVGEAFGREFSYAETLIRRDMGRPGKVLLDLVEANRRQLVDAGLRPDAVSTVAECTACGRDADGRRRYYSYRAEGGVSGRMLSAIGVVVV